MGNEKREAEDADRSEAHEDVSGHTPAQSKQGTIGTRAKVASNFPQFD